MDRCTESVVVAQELPHLQPHVTPADPHAALVRDLDALRLELDALRGPADIVQFRQLEVTCWILLLTGLGLSALGLNPLSPLLLALAASIRWMVIAHHVCHGALDGLPGVPQRLTSRGFAQGWRRWLQWPDWIEPQAWKREHNQLHHAYTNERADPDLVEQQTEWLRQSRLPTVVRLGIIAFLACTWRWLYYAPNTTACLYEKSGKRVPATALVDSAPETRIWNPLTPLGRQLWLKSWLPQLLFQFGLLPLLLLPLGWHFWLVALIHVAIAELLTSLHTFLVIVPNHAGPDLQRFETRSRGKGQWYARQIASSCNYRTGSDLNDVLHGWLNYQIEHHVWPDLTPRQYQVAAPKLKIICQRHGLPYVQQSIFRRAWLMVGVATGRHSLLRADAPVDVEERIAA